MTGVDGKCTVPGWQMRLNSWSVKPKVSKHRTRNFSPFFPHPELLATKDYNGSVVLQGCEMRNAHWENSQAQAEDKESPRPFSVVRYDDSRTGTQHIERDQTDESYRQTEDEFLASLKFFRTFSVRRSASVKSISCIPNKQDRMQHSIKVRIALEGHLHGFSRWFANLEFLLLDSVRSDSVIESWQEVCRFYLSCAFVMWAPCSLQEQWHSRNHRVQAIAINEACVSWSLDFGCIPRNWHEELRLFAGKIQRRREMLFELFPDVKARESEAQRSTPGFSLYGLLRGDLLWLTWYRSILITRPSS